MSKRASIRSDTNGREVVRSSQGSCGASGSFSSSSGGKRLREEGLDSEENYVADGKRYKGKFHQKHWQGTLTCTNGDKYEGQFYEDKKHGQGTLTCTNVGKYEGQWHEDEMHGQGTLTSTNGDKYEGQWHQSQYIPGSADEQNKSTTCVVCQVKQREMAFSPCNHCCVCTGCAIFDKFNGKCPICRQPATGMLRIYG